MKNSIIKNRKRFIKNSRIININKIRIHFLDLLINVNNFKKVINFYKCVKNRRKKLSKKFIKISCELKRNILRMFKILLCQKFSYDFESCIITFDNKVNNNKDYNRIKNLCYYYDVNFKYLNNYKIEIIY